MKLNIVSPNGILFEGEAANISFPGLGGSFDVLPHHAPIIAALMQARSSLRQTEKCKNNRYKADS